MWHLLFKCGAAFRDADAERAVRAMWDMLVPQVGVDWFNRQAWSAEDFDRMLQQFADVWWHYLLALPVNAKGKKEVALTPQKIVCLVEAGCLRLKKCLRMRSVFVAVLFQLAVTGRHDQSACGVMADPACPPFYGKYVNRCHLGSMFSLKALIAKEKDYACARTTVNRFRGVRNRVVAEIFDTQGKELIRRPRSKIKRFKCLKCSERLKPGCTRCTRLQEHNSGGVISYYDHNHEWKCVADAQTVCSDVEFLRCNSVRMGSRIVHDGKLWTLNKRARTRDKDDTVILHLRQYTGKDATVSLQRHSKSLLAVASHSPDCYQMMRDNPDVVHSMCLSVLVDAELAIKCDAQSANTFVKYKRASPIRIRNKDNTHAVAMYAVWRSLVSVVAFAHSMQGKKLSQKMQRTLALAKTHYLTC